MTRKKTVRTIFFSALALVLALVLTVGGYLAYVLIDYERIPDKQVLTPVGGEGDVKAGVVYTALSYNIGFGAYTPDFTFFMDGGTESRAESRESVLAVLYGIATLTEQKAADFYLFQEVDTDADRSHHVNQADHLRAAFPTYGSVFAYNYHSSYLFWPLFEPHGASDAGLLSLSCFAASGAVRRSLPISEGLSKFLDLDRAYTVTRYPVEGGGELCVYNVHTSAYGGSEEIRTAQMSMLLSDMKAEYDKGNWCVAGGDFNHDFSGTSVVGFNGEGADYGWAQPFPAALLPEGIDRVLDDGTVPSCRNCDLPYSEDSFVLTVDGFLVSDNVVARSRVLDIGFVYSDHNPVELEFMLMP